MDKSKIIDYLYGEMNEVDRNDFLREMEGNASLRQEVEALEETRSILSGNHIEATVSAVVLPHKRKFIVPTKWWVMAASLLLLLCLGKLLDIRVKIDDHQLAIQYGEVEVMDAASKENPTEDRMNQLMAQIAELQTEWIKFTNQPVQEEDNNDYDQLKQEMARWVNSLREQQEKNNNMLVQQMQKEQGQNTALLIDEFMEYIEVQRQEDLHMINTGFNNLAQMIQFGGDPKTLFAYDKIQK